LRQSAVAKPRIERHPEVIAADLPAIYQYIASDSPQAADRVFDAVAQTFDLIRDQPDCGVVYRTRNSKLQGIRMLPVSEFPQYLVFYRVEGETVRILYVVHGARNLTRLFRRTQRV
jgi:toxin ParE1/3/4